MATSKLSAGGYITRFAQRLYGTGRHAIDGTRHTRNDGDVGAALECGADHSEVARQFRHLGHLLTLGV
jgi:hypothetical protein